MAKNLSTRAEDYAEWYNQLVVQADLAEHSGIKGSMVIKPYGYAIWEKMQRILDDAFKATGHQNAYFPLLIPKSYLSKEAAHVEGFAKECAVVTHYRLKTSPDGKSVVVDPEAKLEEELIIRPTSETVIWSTFKNWIQSYRDLPLLINQWANVLRWEMRTRLFLRTSEFLWQEGHTAHATRAEAIAEAEQMLKVYAHFAEQYMAMPVLQGIKTANERFAGAEETYCIEALMQDGKALQAGTSHFLGQNFAKAFDVTYLTREQQPEYVWATSWGVSTRLMGALVMTHSDDHGLVLPPRLAPIHVVVVPVYKSLEDLAHIGQQLAPLIAELRAAGYTVKLDDDDTKRPGWKYAEWELKGVPLRLAVGMRDLENGVAEVFRRDTLTKESLPLPGLAQRLAALLEEIQQSLLDRARSRMQAQTYTADSYADFKQKLEAGGFIRAHWDGTTETEQKIKDETKATIRCIPLDEPAEAGTCIYSGQPSRQRVVFARAY
ncbi:MAG: proline--tRNA ligase [Bacteroidetes bacterium]|jgi:prolyl-tRNA synthetase|nr:proline--tRNA ligase [Bacteroidota bacterium]